MYESFIIILSLSSAQVLWSQCWSFSCFEWLPAAQLSRGGPAGWLQLRQTERQWDQ